MKQRVLARLDALTAYQRTFPGSLNSKTLCYPASGCEHRDLVRVCEGLDPSSLLLPLFIENLEDILIRARARVVGTKQSRLRAHFVCARCGVVSAMAILTKFPDDQIVSTRQ